MRSGLGARQVQHTPTIWKNNIETHKPSCFNFSYGFNVLLFDFSPA